ncbi:uncharacterized protein TNCV_2543731 [Trichonephila clavipes]|nr:uncharacterized protein TNCV_2543731 [Trichonephila clavipes]
MPASLLLTSSPSLRGVTRNESTRSDSSAASNTSQSSATGNKKVSFNKAVRVKKYPRPKKGDAGPYNDSHETNGSSGVNGTDEIPGSPGKRFWFKVYKNKHRQSPDLNEFRPKNNVIYYGNDVGGDTNGYHHDDVISYHPNPSVLNYPVFTSECGTQTPSRKSDSSSRTALLGNEFTPLHPSQMPSDPPEVRKNYVKKIVNRFNEEAVLQRQLSFEDQPGSPQMSPPGSPRQHSTPKHIPIPPPPPPPTNPYKCPPVNLPPQPEGLFTTPRSKKNHIVNGVKVMFGIDDHKNEVDDHDAFHRESPGSKNRDKSHDGINSKSGAGSYRTEVVLTDGSETEVKSPYPPHDTFLFGDEPSHALVKRNGGLDISRGRDNRHDGNGYYYEEGDDPNRRGKYHIEAWDTGNQLLFDTTDVNTATSHTDKGQFMSTVGEKHQLWRNNKRVVVYEEPSPTVIRRKAKSQSDLLNADDKPSPEEKLDKGVSTDELFIRSPDKKDTLSKKQKDSWLRHFRSATKDKGIQCNKVPTDEPQELYGFGKYKIIRPRNGTVTAFSNVPKIEKVKHKDQNSSSQVDAHNSKNSVIYSQVDKTKKKKNGEKEKKKHLFSENGRIGSLFKSRSEPLYIGPPPKNHQQLEDEIEEDGYYEDKGERMVKTSKKSFGFRLGNTIERNHKSPYYEEDWYNVDGDVEAVERQKRRGRNHRDIAEIRQEMAEEEISDASSLSNGDQKRNGGVAGSVMREVDYKKREISYENVPRSDGEGSGQNNVGSGLWYRDADEDYRKEMAQSEVSYPAGNSVGSERFYTVDRREKTNKKLPPPSPRAYTLDRRHMKNKEKQKSVPNTSGVKILVNGKEIKDKSSTKKSKKREDPSSVQSDPLCVRGGLAAAYQARQRAAVRRSNSSVSGLSNSRYHSGSSPNIRRIVASSDISAASSESESSRHRRPLVMYIPGVSHPEKSSENEDRVSSSIARSQSMMTPTRPPRMVKRINQRGHKGSKIDLYRSGDIYEEDEIMPLASEVNRKKPPKVPVDSKKHSDIKRRHSMPKDTKFSWLKWRIRGKPSREP